MARTSFTTLKRTYLGTARTEVLTENKDRIKDFTRKEKKIIKEAAHSINLIISKYNSYIIAAEQTSEQYPKRELLYKVESYDKEIMALLRELNKNMRAFNQKAA